MKKIELNDELVFSLIIEDLDHTITPENKVLLDEWRKVNAENEKVYQDYLHVQVNLDKINDRCRIDTQSSWESLEKKLEVKPRNVFHWYKLAAAATVLVILSVSLFFVFNRNSYIVIHTEDSVKTGITLPDGTLVNMNAATTIRYHKNNFTVDRKLELLKGEIFVHVTKHDAPQFIVDMGKVTAKDIGTSFNVFRNDDKVEVIIADGLVALRHLASKKEVLLKKGQLGFYNVKTEQLKAAHNTDINYKSWIDKKFIFNEVPFEEVTGQLEKAYHTTILINGEELKHRKLTARLHYQNIDSAMAVISASMQCKVTKDKDTYVLSDL